jgi:hypothetical protein
VQAKQIPSLSKKDLLSLLEIINEDKTGLIPQNPPGHARQFMSSLQTLFCRRVVRLRCLISTEHGEMLYSSSSAKWTKDSAGLGRKFSQWEIWRLKQKLQASKYMSDAEYIERIEVTLQRIIR